MPRKPRGKELVYEVPENSWFSEEPKFPKEKKHNINVNPLNEVQNQLWNQLNDRNITVIVAHGCAGTGKSYLSMAWAAKQLAAKNYDRLILTRSSIPSTKSIGFFPGTVEDKLSPWLKSYIKYLRDFVGNGTADMWLKPNEKQKVIMQPMEVLRGSSWEDSIVLVEEVQNLTFKELKMILTRVGENCRLILSGDLGQSDISNPGLSYFLSLVEKYNIEGVGVTQFTSDDIVRCGFVKSFVKALEKDES